MSWYEDMSANFGGGPLDSSDLNDQYNKMMRAQNAYSQQIYNPIATAYANMGGLGGVYGSQFDSRYAQAAANPQQWAKDEMYSQLQKLVGRPVTVPPAPVEQGDDVTWLSRRVDEILWKPDRTRRGASRATPPRA